MKRKNTTRNALFSSIISLLLCVSMLVGTTFAWFTDEVKSGMNTIAAGNLDVELLADGVKVDSNTKLFSDVEKWEPGVVVYENLQVANVGTLALKYQMTLNFGNENHLNGHKLSEVLKVAIIDKVAEGTDRADVLAAAKEAIAASGKDASLGNFYLTGELEAGTSSTEKSIVIFWEPNSSEIDNLYNANNGQVTSDGKPLHIEFGVNLQATQMMSEEDSFGKDYDDFASILPKAIVNNVSATYPTVNATAGIGGAVDTVPMDFVLQFLPNETFEECMTSDYKYYNIDFVIKADKDVPAESIALSGFYSLWCDGFNNSNWVYLTSPEAITAGTEIRLVEGMGQGAIKVSYKDICQYAVREENTINGFLCGATDLTGENAGTTITVELRAYETTSDPTDSSNTGVEVGPDAYSVVGTYTYTFYNRVSNAAELKEQLELGNSVSLSQDIEVDANTSITIPAGSNPVIELNGRTLSGVSTETGKNRSLIVVGKDAELTVKNGMVTMEHTGTNMGWNNSTQCFDVVSGGKLTLDHVKVVNRGGSDMAYAVNIGNNGGATLKTIASTLESQNYNALRIFNNADGAINVDLTEGTVLTGSGSPFFVHFWTEADLGAKQAERQAYLTVNFNDTVVSRYSGSKSLIRFGFTDAIYYSSTAMTEVVAGNEKALNWALENGKNVLLNNDLALNSALVVNGTAVIDLNGYTLSAKNTESKASCAINNKGDLTLKNGTVTYEGVGDPAFGYGTNTINNTGKLVIDGATIENTTATGSSVAIDCSAGANLIINSGEIKSEKNAIRLCPFGSGAINCTINGGTITGTRAIQIQLPSNKPADAPVINLTVNGGTLNGTGDLSLYSYSAGQSFANVKVTITDGIFSNDVAFGGGSAKTTQETVSITGGTFNGDLGRYVEDDGTNDGWEDIAKP